jgi:hypothetical protein
VILRQSLKLEEALDEGQLEEIIDQGEAELKLIDDYAGRPPTPLASPHICHM